MKKYLVCIVFVLANFSNTVLASFTDVPFNSKSILWLQENGVVNGYEDGTFRPENEINRAEFLKMLYETIGMENFPNDGLSNIDNPFIDISSDEWYTKYVLYAYANNVIDGYADGTFKPEKTINFAEAFKMVQEAFFQDWSPSVGWQYINEYDPCYKDLGPSNWDKWYWGYIHYLDNYCIIPEDVAMNGDEFDASKNVTRKDMAELFYRAQTVRYNSKNEYGLTVFSKYTIDMISGGVGAFRVPLDLPIIISTPGFDDDGGFLSGKWKMISEKSTCEGENISPSLIIENIPDGTKSLVLIVDDPDSSSGVWTHWTLWNIDPNVTEIAENSIPEGAIEGLNSWGEIGYKGPCPSPSSVSMHEYYFKIYALDTKLELNMETTGPELLKALLPHLLNSGWTGGLYPHY